ncbi:MAG: TRAP-type mannitol/chloroaromatic compound transport system permease small subunit [Planctomycetota bacterium]|jgi:TRAP-type mannitol/chloroaromatic compound transport system permease small subunit
MQALLWFAARIDALNRWFGKFVAILTGAMVLLGAGNALARWLERDLGLQISSNAYIEAQWYLFSLIFLLGAAHTLAVNEHVRVDVLYGRLSVRSKVWVDLVGMLVFLLPFCAFALWASLPSVSNSLAVLEVSPDPGGLARYPIKSAILACFALLILQGISETIKRVAWLGGSPLWPGALPSTEEASP